MQFTSFEALRTRQKERTDALYGRSAGKKAPARDQFLEPCVSLPFNISASQ